MAQATINDSFEVRLAQLNNMIQELFQSEEDVALYAVTMLNWVDDVSEALGVDLRAAQQAMNAIDHQAPASLN